MNLEPHIKSLGTQLFEMAKKEEPGLFNKNYWQGRILDWVMKDPSFKVDLLRFVDVLPQLQTSEAISEHIKQYLLREDRTLPTLISTALKAATSKLTGRLATKAIKDNVMDMAGRFILGASGREASKELKKLHLDGIAFTADLLGEATLSETEAAVYQQRYLALVDELSTAVQQWPTQKVIDENHLGPIPRANISIKLSSVFSQIRPQDPKGSVQKLKERVTPILRLAKEKNAFINFDLEQWDFHEVTYDLFEDIALDQEFRNWPHLGIVVQAYLKNAEKDIQRLISITRSRKCPVTVRLVKGAYWDYEIVRARQKGLMPPVLLGKGTCDVNYEKLSAMLLNNFEHVHLALGSHNLRSLAHAICYAEQKKVPKNAYEVQMLFGMAEPERKALRALGHRLRLYSPIGDPLVGMAYLVRRLLENTSNSGFLQLTHHAKADVSELIKPPSQEEFRVPQRTMKTEPEDLNFDNCHFLDFLEPKVRSDFQEAVSSIKEKLPAQIPLVIDGEAILKTPRHSHISPGDKSLKVFDLSCATIEECERAVVVAQKGFDILSKTPIKNRVEMLNRLADILEKDRIWLAALQTIEVGKPWTEADADVAEAIDFCRFYAKNADRELGERPVVQILGEENFVHFVGRGPTVIIAPWNFPLAILCGMSTAALVAGNSILMKPAEQSSMTAHALFQRMIQAGFPKESVQFVPGVGEEIGPFLVEHPKVAQIAFTGSKEVGLSIYQSAAKISPLQAEMKRVVCEMGGKNAVIVDEDSDLDEAVVGVVASAFGYAGQKCSACSRVLVHESIAQNFIERLIEATKSLELENPTEPSCVLGPVIDKAACDRLLGEIEDAKKSARLLYLANGKENGWYVPPAIFEVNDRNHRLMQNEFFGPIVAIMRVSTFEDALDVANCASFALTGSVFSRSPDNLRRARTQFRVGNLYLNRACSGAMVGRQPFGGFKMSGFGTKAGGFGYLQHFAQPTCVTENTMRRGFTPEFES